MKNFLLCLILLFGASCTASCVFSRSVKDIYTDASPAVFRFETLTGHCSSFHLGNGILITASHCVKPGIRILHISESESTSELTLLLDDAEADVAVFRVLPIKNEPFVTLGPDPAVGERLVTIGFPGYFQAKTIEVSFVLGVQTHKNKTFIYGNNGAFPGESGGPVFNEWGQAVGMVSSVRDETHTFAKDHHLHREVAIIISAEVLKVKLKEALDGTLK